MTTSYTKFKNNIMDHLQGITGATVLEGWLEHHAKDLLDGIGGKTFPAVAARYGSETIESKSQLNSSSGNLTVVITGAVDNLIPETTLERLDKLLYDVKNAIANNKDDRGNPNKLTMTGTQFMLPESSMSYAVFELTTSINYTDKYDE